MKCSLDPISPHPAWHSQSIISELFDQPLAKEIQTKSVDLDQVLLKNFDESMEKIQALFAQKCVEMRKDFQRFLDSHSTRVDMREAYTKLELARIAYEKNGSEESLLEFAINFESFVKAHSGFLACDQYKNNISEKLLEKVGGLTSSLDEILYKNLHPVNPKEMLGKLVHPKDAKELLFLKHLFGKKEFEKKLLYQGSVDGFTRASLLEKVGDLKNTLSLIKIKGTNQVIGAFSDLQWKLDDGYGSSNSAFLFSLTKQLRFPVTNPSKAVYHDVGRLISFGGGRDLEISENCDKNNSSYSNLGNSYQLPPSFEYNTAAAKELLAGVDSFAVEEVEIYHVSFF